MPEDAEGDDLANGFAVPATHRRVWDFSADGVLRSLEAGLSRSVWTAWTAPCCTIPATTSSKR